ncbi:glycosyl transferase family group 2-domain-containing protein [Trametes elegans]|nr:glycosyl transferase family group 2-domain-containing protein [Trametes elegans]
MDYDAYDALLHHIFKQTQGDAWFKPSEENVHAGVCLRVDAGNFRLFPYDNVYLEPFEASVRVLNPVVAVKIRSAAIHAALSTVKPDADAIYIDDNTRIQVLDSITVLGTADKEQCGAFIRDERVLVVWSYQLETIIPTCRDFEEKLIKLVWNRRSENTSISSIAPASSNASSDVHLNEKRPDEAGTKEVSAPAPPAQERPKHAKKRRTCGLGYWVTDKEDVEKTADGPSPRPVRLFAPVYNGLGVAMSIFFIGSGISVLIEEILLDGDYTRLALLVTTPFLFCVSLFFALQIIANLSFILGPVAQAHENSKYYSAVKPAPNKVVDTNLPHITIEMPVYKESLTETIAPSVYSLKKAMQTYARQGGTSSIIVHEDGLQLLNEEERQARIAFYADHNIGWVARPPHSGAPDGYKPSNMNYGLALSLKLETHLLALEAAGEQDTAEECLEDRALRLAIEETFAESGERWRPWAANGKSLRVGEIILIVDSDTIVPEDCLRDAARELAECPEVAIIQHESDVMQNGIAHFTRRINKCISMGCANGRWSALQDAAFVDEADGKKKIWSESNVSEDFDMALRLQLKGYIIRWAAYSEGGFKEGVSLTCDDELNRWQKYSYGCNELIFNPLIDWWRLGPSTSNYGRSSDGLAASALLSVLNYLLLVVFPGAGNLGFTLLEYRLGQRNLFDGLIENVTWIPFFFFFFGGLSIHLSQALLAHLFSYNITWGATKKEVERSNFWLEVPKILKRFWLALVLSVAMGVAMIILATDAVPVGWRIFSWDWAVILPLAIVAGCHIAYPIVLNPWFMIFSY